MGGDVAKLRPDLCCLQERAEVWQAGADAGEGGHRGEVPGGHGPQVMDHTHATGNDAPDKVRCR